MDTRIRVYAVPGHHVPRLDDRGRITDRHVGYDLAGQPLPDGDLVESGAYYARALRDGQITLTAPAPAPAPSTEPEPPSPDPEPLAAPEQSDADHTPTEAD